MKNRFGINVVRGMDATIHHPRGGTVTKTVANLYRMQGYGMRIKLVGGATASIDDVIECKPLPEVYCTTYCNKGHRTKDGKPVDHNCYVLPPMALWAERMGDYELAKEVIRDAGTLREHRGVKAKKVAP